MNIPSSIYAEAQATMCSTATSFGALGGGAPDGTSRTARFCTKFMANESIRGSRRAATSRSALMVRIAEVYEQNELVQSCNFLL